MYSHRGTPGNSWWGCADRTLLCHKYLKCQCAMSDDMLMISLVTKRTGVPRQVFVCKRLVRGKSGRISNNCTCV